MTNIPARLYWVPPVAALTMVLTLWVGMYGANRIAENQARDVCASTLYEVQTPGRIACLNADGGVVSLTDSVPAWGTTVRVVVGIGVVTVLICLPWERFKGREA